MGRTPLLWLVAATSLGAAAPPPAGPRPGCYRWDTYWVSLSPDGVWMSAHADGKRQYVGRWWYDPRAAELHATEREVDPRTHRLGPEIVLCTPWPAPTFVPAGGTFPPRPR